MALNPHLGPTAFVRFRTQAAFEFRLSVFEESCRQRPDGSKEYLTRNRVLLPQIRAAGDTVRVMADNARLPVLPARRWQRDYGRQRVMFVLPSDALGDCVGVVLFLRAFRRRFPQARVTVANTGAATDLFAAEPGVEVLPLLISAKALDAHHPIIDLGEVDGWDAVTTQPVDVEGALLQRFGLDAEDVPVRPVPPSPRVAILPLASSPLRSLPPALVAALAQGVTGRASAVSVVLNAYQGVAAAYEQALRPLLPPGCAVVPGFPTTKGLLDFLAGQDFLVAADSGPAHLAKLSGLPGLAIYTSADGAVLQGRHRNLARWQSPFAGPHCAAPCGLAKLRATADGRVGCMGSLGGTLDDLPVLPNEAQPHVAARLVLEQPVPCVADLAARADQVVAAVLDHLRPMAG